VLGVRGERVRRSDGRRAWAHDSLGLPTPRGGRPSPMGEPPLTLEAGTAVAVMGASPARAVYRYVRGLRVVAALLLFGLAIELFWPVRISMWR